MAERTPPKTIEIGGYFEARWRGAVVKEIVEDYPYLEVQDVEFAKLYVTAYPRVGRLRVREASTR